ncbi:MAG: hypothetical protein ABJH68_01830 [Ilumatobacter sp.]|uniref:hypothetical protein n=1 Tax=Ilumatobacter sp. TaxID=1967498 RepID=UPI00329A185F
MLDATRARDPEHVDELREAELGDERGVGICDTVARHGRVADHLHQVWPVEHAAHGVADRSEPLVVDRRVVVEAFGHEREVDLAVDPRQVVALSPHAAGVHRRLHDQFSNACLMRPRVASMPVVIALRRFARRP